MSTTTTTTSGEGNGIPEDVMKAAMDALNWQHETLCSHDVLERCAKAILAERKRCVEITMNYDCGLAEYPNDEARFHYEAGVIDAGVGIKMRILSASPASPPIPQERQ